MKTKVSNNTLVDTINDLKLFTQTAYCKKYLKRKFPDISAKDLELHSEISSACFRQAFEYYNTANNSPITTSPLLYSYCLNNMAKGLTYLETLYDNILKRFTSHGFTINSLKIKDNLLETQITINKTGATKALLELTNSDTIDSIDITFNELIKRIPSLSDVYEKSTDNKSYVLNRKKEYEYIIIGKIKEEDTINSLLKKMNFHFGYNQYENITTAWVPMSGQDFIDKNENNLMYLDSLSLPFDIDNQLKVTSQLFITYIIVMGYGMLVRYNAHKWEKFIDSKASNESVLISLSVKSCVEEFLNIIHSMLFDYIYIEEKYTDDKVKELLHERETMDIIEDELVERIKREMARYGIR